MLRKTFMVVLTLALVTGLYAQTETDFEVKEIVNPVDKLTHGTMAIVGYKGTVKNVNVPPTVFGRKVTIIEAGAFANKELTGVIISDEVLRIYPDAFKDNKIGTLTLGKKLQFIGARAFANNRISSVTFPPTLKIIGEHAFENNQLFTLVFANGVNLVEKGAFIGNPLVAVVLTPALARRTYDMRGVLLTGISGTAGGVDRAFPPKIIGVTLPGGMDQTVLEANFDEDFIKFWVTRKAAGAYIKQGPVWNTVAVAQRDTYITSQVAIRADEERARIAAEDARTAAEKAKAEAEAKALAEAEAARQKAEAEAQKEREATAFKTALQRTGFTANIRADDTIEITGYSVKGASITIPPTIGGKTVSRIGEGAFQEKISKGEITSISLPITVVEVGRNAFANIKANGKSGSSKLTSITWGVGLKKIEESAFAYNDKLTTIKAGTCYTDTEVKPSAISPEFMLAWLANERPKTYTKKAGRWE